MNINIRKPIKAGYQTAGFGKTHWGRTDQPIGTRGFETRVVGAREVGVEIGAVHYQDDENPVGYDLENDPHEWKSLYNDEKYREIREQLKTELLEHLAVTLAGFPMGNP